jgi:hypothetical protein
MVLYIYCIYVYIYILYMLHFFLPSGEFTRLRSVVILLSMVTFNARQVFQSTIDDPFYPA